MKQAKLEVDFSWRQKGEHVGRGLYKFRNSAPCSVCGRAAEFEQGGTGKAGTGVRICGADLRAQNKKGGAK